MKTTASFFEDFDAAGYLVPATWTPSAEAIAAGAAAGTVAKKVRFREADDAFMDGMVIGAFPSIEYPVAWYPGLIEAELITVTPPEQAAQVFVVKMPPKRGLDGTVAKAFLKLKRVA